MSYMGRFFYRSRCRAAWPAWTPVLGARGSFDGEKRIPAATMSSDRKQRILSIQKPIYAERFLSFDIGNKS